MNKLPIRKAYVLYSFIMHFVSFQREAFSDFLIRFQRMPAYWILFSYVGISRLKRCSATEP